MQTRQRRLRANLLRAIIALVPMVLAAAVIRRVRIAAGVRRGDQAVIDAKRARNKRFASQPVEIRSSVRNKVVGLCPPSRRSRHVLFCAA